MEHAAFTWWRYAVHSPSDSQCASIRPQREAPALPAQSGACQYQMPNDLLTSYLLTGKGNNGVIIHTGPWNSRAANCPITFGTSKRRTGAHIKSTEIPTRFNQYGYPQVKAESLHFDVHRLISTPVCCGTQLKQQLCQCPNIHGPDQVAERQTGCYFCEAS